MIVIPARAGSKRIPSKNVMRLDPLRADSTLLRIAVWRALRADTKEDVVVASDSRGFLKLAEEAGACTYYRSFADDEQTTADLILEMRAKREIPFDQRVCIVEPSAPFVPPWAIGYGECLDTHSGVSSVAVTDDGRHGFRRVGVYSRPLRDYELGGLCWGGRVTMLGVSQAEGVDINTPEDLEHARQLWPLMKKRMGL